MEKTVEANSLLSRQFFLIAFKSLNVRHGCPTLFTSPVRCADHEDACLREATAEFPYYVLHLREIVMHVLVGGISINGIHTELKDNKVVRPLPIELVQSAVRQVRE